MKAGWYYMAGCLAHLFNADAAAAVCGNATRTNGQRWHRGAGGPLDRCSGCQRIAEARKPPRDPADRGTSPRVTTATRWVPQLLELMAHLRDRHASKGLPSDDIAQLLVIATGRRDLRERFQLLVPSCARSGLLEVVRVGQGRHNARYRLPRATVADDLLQVHAATTPEEKAAVRAAWTGKEGK